MSENESSKSDKEEVQVKSSLDFNQNFDSMHRFPIILSKKIIWTLLILISLNHAFLYISPGILSSYITRIKFELKLSDEAYGLFGTINGLGSLIGSIVFTLIIEKVNHKHLIIAVLIINCICHFAFYLKLSYDILLFSRFLSGFVTIFCFTYFPMWVDKFGINKWVNFMQTVVQISKTFGNVLGYFIFLILGNKNWNYGFLIESLLVSVVSFCMHLIPNDYYNKKYIDMEREKGIKAVSTVVNGGNEEKETIMKDIFCNILYLLLGLYKGNIICKQLCLLLKSI